MLTNEEINKILYSSGVENLPQRAVDCMEEESSRPISVKEFIEIRNTLITSLLVCSLRRAQEFIEFNIGEWNNRAELDDGAMVKIRKHKTMSYGSAELILSKIEERAMEA